MKKPEHTHWNIRIYLLSGQSIVLTVTDVRLDTILKELVTVFETQQNYSVKDDKGATHILIVGKNIGSWMTSPVMTGGQIATPDKRLLQMG